MDPVWILAFDTNVTVWRDSKDLIVKVHLYRLLNKLIEVKSPPWRDKEAEVSSV